MKLNRWTSALAAAGVVSLGSVLQAEEAQNQVMTALSSTTLSGYVSTSAIWKFGTGNGLVGRVFDGTAKQDGFNLDVVKVTIEKPLDEGEWSAGYKADLLFGPDASFYNPGLGVGSSDVGIKQAYVNVRVPAGNGIDVKMGAFDTCIGYEVFDIPSNPNYSRSYAYGIEPFAHTGVMASYKVNDVLSLSAGVANTYSTGINTRANPPRSESEKTYLGLITLTAPESAGFLAGGTLYAGVVDGINTAWTASDTTHWYVGGTMPTPVEGLTLGAAYDYRGTKEQGDPSAGGVNSTYANAVAGYVSYQVTEKLKVNGRAEYATATNGTWYFSPDVDPNNELFGLTATLDYSLWENVLSRLEVRWDHCSEKVFGSAADPDKNALSLALNMVYRF